MLEFRALKKPRGRSIILGFAPSVVICARVWRRKPFEDVLFYLCPYAENLVSTTDAIRGRMLQTLYFFNFALDFLRIVRYVLHSHIGFVDT